MSGLRHTPRRAAATLAGLVPLLVLALSLPGHAAAAPRLRFGRETIVDYQRVAGEPVISIDHRGRIYVSAPFGFSTSASFVWRSGNGGRTFHLVPGSAPPVGKPTTCAGGGDSALAVDTANRVYFADLQGLTDVSNSVSSDRGATWKSSCNAANATGVDRPWIATFGNPRKGGALYQTVDQIGQCTTECGLGQIGNNVVEITRSQDGVNFMPLPAQKIEPDGIVSGIITDRRTGTVYIAHTGLVNRKGHLVSGGDGNGNANAIVVVRFKHGYRPSLPAQPIPTHGSLCHVSPKTCTSEIVFRGPLARGGNSLVNVGQDFAPIAIDRKGNLYAAWSQTPVNPKTGLNSGSSQIFLSVSTDHGLRWGRPVRVTAGTPHLRTNVFPWVVAGSPGRVDVVWYGTQALGKCPKQPCGPGGVRGKWFVMMAQSIHAVRAGRPNPHPRFSRTTVSEISNHHGSICTFGIACGSADRGLLDFLGVAVDRRGAADVVWSDAVNRNKVGGQSSALIAFGRQRSGYSLYAGHGRIRGGRPARNHARGTRPAVFSANGRTVKATANLAIRSVRMTRPDRRHYRIRIALKSLRSLSVPARLGGTDPVWLVRWEVPQPKGPGHTYFAAMESDGGGKPSFFEGHPAATSTSHAKFLTYPPAHGIRGRVIRRRPGVIILRVPVRLVGGHPRRRLFAVTALTATQSSPSQSKPIFNLIDASAPFDFAPRR